jgi:2,4-dienoyl-CoA reductase-like NADH-dependent reductase (Old Yellow Enzyme family)
MQNTIFSPVNVGKLTISNRLVIPAMVMGFCGNDGTATERYIAYHQAKAKGGWGLIITEDYAVDPVGIGNPNIPGLWEDKQIESHSKLTRAVHNANGKIVAQIYHAGRQTSSKLTGCQPVAPSAIPCPVMQEQPRELTLYEIEDVVEKFGDCAYRARLAGFDGVEIHGAHGYLVNQFISPVTNKRVDKYGGNLLNRMRFALEIIANIREKAGLDFPIIFRISAQELVPGGITIGDSPPQRFFVQ